MLFLPDSDRRRMVGLGARRSHDYRHHRSRQQENHRGDGKDYVMCGLAQKILDPLL